MTCDALFQANEMLFRVLAFSLAMNTVAILAFIYKDWKK